MANYRKMMDTWKDWRISDKTLKEMSEAGTKDVQLSWQQVLDLQDELAIKIQNQMKTKINLHILQLSLTQPEKILEMKFFLITKLIGQMRQMISFLNLNILENQ